ncbi:hypothetical protein PS943_02260 [Pseudomonas fluorescens]|uniref:HTH araC/xylS-type domain-containing protein n=1 Tax=Pseudomonas fluorescens TaxID=294 RepID=A0A5E7W8M4_PSEFL|nr:hypothetical protein PS943_02260 [Pseudomonas fluorescens]
MTLRVGGGVLDNCGSELARDSGLADNEVLNKRPPSRASSLPQVLIGYSAFDLGFASDSAFIAFFKDMTGSTPGSWFK